MFMTFIPGKHLSIYTIPIMFFTIISEIIIYHFSCPHELVYAFINLFTQLINIYKAPNSQSHWTNGHSIVILQNIQ